MKERFKNTFVRSTRAGHVETMGDEKLAKRTDAQKMEEKWMRGMPSRFPPNATIFGTHVTDARPMPHDVPRRPADAKSAGRPAGLVSSRLYNH